MVRNEIERRNRSVYSVGTISLMAVFVMSCMKWLIEGILDKPILEPVLCMLVLVLFFFAKGMRLYKKAAVWLLFMINIVLSLATHSSTLGLWGRGFVTILTAALILFIREPLGNYRPVLKLIAAFGFVNAGLVILHFLSGGLFERLYIPHLNETAANTARLYIRYGYYFGLLYNPHEPAALISFSIAALLMSNTIKRERSLWRYLVCAALVIPLLMTGKKAVFICSILAFVIVVLAFYASRKQFIRGLLFLFLIIAAVTFFIAFAMSHPELAFFNRFNSFFQNALRGEVAGAGRLLLYRRALEEWNEHKLLGIGWRHFNALTVSKFRLTQSHEVNCDYLQWLCETGIVGFVLSIIPVGIMLFRTLHINRKQMRQTGRYDDTEEWIIMMASYIQYFILIYAFVEIPFFDIVTFSMYVISCVIINSVYKREDART